MVNAAFELTQCKLLTTQAVLHSGTTPDLANEFN